MNCPHCDKDIDLDATSPVALLLHLKKNLVQAQAYRKEMLRLHGPEWTKCDAADAKIAKWQAWHDWVQKQSESEETNGND